MPTEPITDEHQLLDLFIACKPSKGQHRLAFSIVFTPTYSRTLKKKNERYIAEAYRTVRDFFKNDLNTSNKIAPISDIVLVVEEGYKKDRDGNFEFTAGRKVKVLHVHGWVKTPSTFSSSDLELRVRQRKKSRKLDQHRGILVRDYNPQWEFDYLDEYSYEDEYIHIDSGQTEFNFNPIAHPVDT